MHYQINFSKVFLKIYTPFKHIQKELIFGSRRLIENAYVFLYGKSIWFATKCETRILHFVKCEHKYCDFERSLEFLLSEMYHQVNFSKVFLKIFTPFKLIQKELIFCSQRLIECMCIFIQQKHLIRHEMWNANCCYSKNTRKYCDFERSTWTETVPFGMQRSKNCVTFVSVTYTIASNFCIFVYWIYNYFVKMAYAIKL